MLIKVWLGDNEGEEQPKLVKASITLSGAKGTGTPTVLEIGSDKDDDAKQEASFTLRPGEKLEITELRPDLIYDPVEKSSVEGLWPNKEKKKMWEDWRKKEEEKKGKAEEDRLDRLAHPAPPPPSSPLGERELEMANQTAAKPVAVKPAVEHKAPEHKK